MDQNTMNTFLPQAPVLSFNTADEATLDMLRQSLALTAESRLLCRLKALFANARHTPTAAELQLFDALAAYLPQYGTDAAITALDFANEEEARVWQDMLRLHEKNAKAAMPPTLNKLLSLSTVALKVAGRSAALPYPLCDTPNALTARFGGNASPHALDLGGVQIALDAQASTPKKPTAGLSLLAVRTSLSDDQTDVIARFFKRYSSFSPIWLAAIGEEGLGAYLPCLSYGMELDLATIGATDIKDLLTAVPCTALIAMAPQHAAAALAEGAPATLIGRISKTPQLTVKNGLNRLACLPATLLSTWQLLVARAGLTHTAALAEHEAPRLTASDDMLLCGVSYTGNTLLPLLKLLQKTFLAGGNMHSATLCAALRLPKNSLADAVTPLLAYHRFTAELALPMSNTKVLYDPTVSAPTLTVGLAAKKRPLGEDEATSFQNALKKGDFSALRAAIYKTV